MSLNPKPRESSRLGLELSAFDRLLQTEPTPLLIGGQAVNLWALVFLQESRELQALQPFLSRDCDLFGDQEVLLQLAEKTKWKMTFSRKGEPSPVTGYLMHRDEHGRTLLVEVLYSVKGLTNDEMQKEVLVQLGERSYRTLSPVSLLKAKLANFVELPQNEPDHERNDLRHIVVLIPCVAAYLDQALDRVKAGRYTERSFINLLERTLAIVRSDHASRTAKATELDFLPCFPLSLKSCPLLKVQHFVQRRLMLPQAK